MAFAEAVGTSRSVITDVVKGRLRPPVDRLKVWADKLDLSGEKKEAFLLAGWLTHSPTELVSYLENKGILTENGLAQND